MEQFNQALSKFLASLISGEIEVYNEFSVQHELGIILRGLMPSHKVQFERNIGDFSPNAKLFTKREIDIIAFEPQTKTPALAVELKFPRNGQHPESMFSFCKDIAFLEELKDAGFQQTVFLAFAEDPLFYEGKPDGIYGYFRAGIPISGRIQKPTGKRDQEVTIKGTYNAQWKSVFGSLKYLFVNV